MIEHQNKQKDLKDLQEKNKNEKHYILYFIGIHNFGLVHLELTFLFSKKKVIENSSEWVWGKSVKEFMSYDRTSKQTNRDYNFT